MFSKGTRRALIAAMAVTASTVGTLYAAASPELLDETHASVRAVKALQDKVTRDLMKLENVLGTAIGVDDNGTASLVVYVEKGGRKTPDLLQTLPATMSGIPVKVEQTEQFRAFARPPRHGGGGTGGGGGGTVSGPGTLTPASKHSQSNSAHPAVGAAIWPMAIAAAARLVRSCR